jgi:hypothetical protein
MLRLGCQGEPGAISPNGAPALAQPIAPCTQGQAVPQNLVGQGMHRCVGISGIEFCDDGHTLLPIFLIALPPVLGPPLRALLSSHLHESLKGPEGLLAPALPIGVD